MNSRDYDSLAESLAAQLSADSTTEERMQAAVDALWSAFSEQGVSWCGFYLPDEDGGALLLGPRRDKPACSPIALHGVCGRACRDRAALVINDVKALGPDYIACDPRDRSEVVVPVLAADGSCAAVLDLDSHALNSFAEADVKGLEKVLQAAGLSAPKE
jgi:L-methionine (R)-S-oxide reductase